jgi:hypothetical protein
MTLRWARYGLAATAAAAIGFANPVAAAPTGDDYGDARCYLVFSFLADLPVNGRPLTAEERGEMNGVASYFLGKVKGRNPSLDLATILSPAIIRDVQANLQSQMQRCVPETETMMAALSLTADMLEQATMAR